MSDTQMKKKYKYNRLCAAINFNDSEIQIINKIVEDNFKNNNQFVEFLIRDYMKKYTNENKQADVNTENNNIIVDNQNNNNNNISIGDLNNSIDDLKNSINNLNNSINILIERLPDKNQNNSF